jgi:hypothetical protein
MLLEWARERKVTTYALGQRDANLTRNLTLFNEIAFVPHKHYRDAFLVWLEIVSEGH